MNATKLTLIGLAAATIVFSGCSRDNRVTGPSEGAYPDIDKDQVELITLTETESNSARISISSFEQQVKRISFEAVVKRSEVEGGCWYLETREGNRYTPHFESNAPKLYVGRQIYVSGYIDQNMSSYCMIGPVFTIEKYANLTRRQDENTVGMKSEAAKNGSESATVDAEENGSQSAATDGNSEETVDAAGASQADRTILRGFFGISEKGCFYLYNEKGIIAELYFTQKICPNIQDGDLIAVKGDYSLLTWSPCQLARLFNVEKFQVLKSNDTSPKEDRAKDQ